MKKIILLLMFSASYFASTAQQGFFDTTFFSTGVRTIGLLDFNHFNDVLIQPDGKIVCVGESRNTSGNNRLVVARFLSNGSSDLSFGNGGYRIISTPNKNITGYYLALQADGKVLVQGMESSNTAAYHGFVARLNSNGNLDHSFASGGILRFPNLLSAPSAGIAVLNTGRILTLWVGFNTWQPNANHYLSTLIAINSSGGLDSNFNQLGYSFPLLPYNNLAVWDIAAGRLRIDQNNRIYIVGERQKLGLNIGCFVQRLLSDGSPDSSFASNGFFETENNDIDLIPSDFDLHNNKIYIVGRSISINSEKIRLLKLNYNGTRDTTFSNDGYVDFNFKYYMDIVRKIRLNSFGEILIAGVSRTSNNSNSTNTNSFLLKILNNGDIDTTFGFSGYGQEHVDSSLNITGLAIQLDGKIVMTGSSGKKLYVSRHNGSFPMNIYENPNIAPQIKLFPNPVVSQAYLNLVLLENCILDIYLIDVQGKLIQTFFEKIAFELGEHTLELDGFYKFPDAPYFIIVSYEQGIVSIPVIKRNKN